MHYLFLKENDEQTKRLYVNRAFSSNRYYCVTDGYPDACTSASEATGKDGCVFIAAQTVELVVFDVRGGIRRLFHGRF
jgi:hypothetical protein